MGKVAVKIVDDGSAVAGLVDYATLYPLVDDIVVVGVDVTAANVAGGVLPITQATATALGVGNPILALSPAAYYQFGVGVTVTGAGVSMWADQADSDNSLVLPGVAGNYASTPDSVPLSITGDIDIRVRVSLDDWTPGTTSQLVSKRNNAIGSSEAYSFAVSSTGLLYFTHNNASTQSVMQSTAAVSASNGALVWVKVTWTQSSGDINFYQSASETNDPSAVADWVKIGATVAGPTTNINDGVRSVAIGANPNNTESTVCRVYRVIIKNGIDGTTVFDANFAAQAKGTPSFSESSSNAATVTVNQSGALPAHIGSQKDLLQGTDANRPVALLHTGTNYLYLPGVAGNYASTPDSVPNSITGDIDIRVRVALDDWTPAASNVLASKYVPVGNYGFIFRVIATTGGLQLLWTEDGTNSITKTSTASPTVSDGASIWVRVTLDVDNGSTQNEVKFYTAPDSDSEPTSWTQLGSTVTTAGTTSIFDSTSPLEVGARNAGGTEPLSGKIYRASIYSTIGGTTPVVDFNPSDATDSAASFASQTTGETWTVNSTGALPAQIVGSSRILCDGVDNYLKTNAFTLNQPTTVVLVFKQVSWTNNEYLTDGGALGTGRLSQFTTSPQLGITSNNVNYITGNGDLAVGAYGVAAIVFNGASSLLQINNGTPSTGDAGAGNMGGFTLGAAANAGSPSNIQVYEAAIFPTALSAADRASVAAYLMAKHGIS